MRQVLKEHPTDVEAALQEYTRRRLPDVLALVRLNQVCLLCGAVSCLHLRHLPSPE